MLILRVIIALVLGCSGVSLAKALDKEPPNWVMSNGKGGEMMLEVKQMPLSQALDAIAGKIHVPIHYSELPEGLATAVCRGDSLKPVLECLLDKKADLVVRYQDTHAKADTEGVVVEAWVLTSKTNQPVSKPITHDIPASENRADKSPSALPLVQQNPETRIDKTDELLFKAHSYNPQERAAAIGDLLTVGRKGDPDITATLEEALTDKDPEVRAQAISSLAHREGNEALGAIQQALTDSSDDVRLMAVEGIVDNVALLQQSVNDSDESIRSLAQLKLELLTRGQYSNP